MNRRPALPLLLVLLVALAGCGAASAAQQSALRTTYVSLTTAQAAFASWDRAAQYAIIANGVATDSSREDTVAKLQAYRLKREVVVDAFTTAYQALAAAAGGEAVTFERALRAWRDLAELLKRLTNGRLP